MKLLYINPNATEAMTHSLVAVAQEQFSQADVTGWTNHDGPPSIQGPDDGARAVQGIMAMLPPAREQGFDAIVIGCFDDTGLAQMRAAAHCPVIGIGQAAYTTAMLLGQKFAVVTTLDVSVPVIQGNIDAQGYGAICAGVFASGLPVLTVDEGSEATRRRLADTIVATHAATDAGVVVLGCAGMAHLRGDLQDRTGLALIDGVVASAGLAAHLVRCTAKGGVLSGAAQRTETI